MFDVEFARSHFPALAGDWVLMDNAGGSVVPRSVLDRVRAYMERYQVQLGASYALSVEAGAEVRAGQTAMAQLINAEPEEVVLGPSTTIGVYVLAQALQPSLEPGDEIVVTNLDHEANIGAWRRLEERGVVLREWRFDRDTGLLELEGLEPLLGERTRLVCFTHCSNIVGAFHDVAAITRRVHEAGARVCVDGVAFAPHRRVDVKALDVDFYLMSLYKTLGPHLGLLYGKREHLAEARGQYHFFVGEDELPAKLQPGNVNYELAAALPGILDYLDALHHHHFPGVAGEHASRLERVFGLVAAHEEALAAPLLDYLAHRQGVRIIGPETPDGAVRAPTISFVAEGRDSSSIPEALDLHHIAVRYGHFYAYRAIRDLGLLEQNGVVRVSLLHYNTETEVERLLRALDQVLKTTL